MPLLAREKHQQFIINTAQVQQNRLIRILSKTYKQKVKLSFLFSKWNKSKIEGIYNLETLKFMCKFKTKMLPTPFQNYFTPSIKLLYLRNEKLKKRIDYLSQVNKNLLKDQSKYVEPKCGTNS